MGRAQCLALPTGRPSASKGALLRQPLAAATVAGVRGGGGGGAWQPQPWHRLFPGPFDLAIVCQPCLGAIPTASPVSERLTPVCARRLLPNISSVRARPERLPCCPSSMPAPMGGLAQLVCRLPRHSLAAPGAAAVRYPGLGDECRPAGFGLSLGDPPWWPRLESERPGRPPSPPCWRRITGTP